MFTILRIILGTLVTLSLIALGWWAFRQFVPVDPSLEDPFRQAVAEIAAQRIADKLPTPITPGLLCFTELSGDEKGNVIFKYTKTQLGWLRDKGYLKKMDEFEEF